jgi:peptide/nickel transport system substrate-binding protein
VDAIFYGRSRVIDTYIPPEHPLYAGDRLVSYDYDPEAGIALLEDVGWVDGDSDGIREASGIEGIPDGTPLEFTWQSTTDSLRVQYMRIFQQNLADCGFQVNLENLFTAEYFADGPNGPLFGRQFDLGSFPWLITVEPPCELYLSSEIPAEENGWTGANNPGFINEEYDAACSQALTALPGSEDSVEGHKEAQRVFTEQLPVVPLFLHIKVAATRPEVQGFVVDPTEMSEMWNIETLDLVTE